MRIADLKHPMSVISKTQAFKDRDNKWPFESWDYTEWEECIDDVEKEIGWKEKT